MTMAMDPPPPQTLDETQTSFPSSTAPKTDMGPPPLKPQTGNTPEVEADPTNSEAAEEPVENLPETDHDSAETTLEPSSHQSAKVVVPYTIPPWSGAPCHQFYLEVLKDGSIVDQFDV